MEVNNEIKELQGLDQTQEKTKPASSKTNKTKTVNRTKKLTDEEKLKEKEKLEKLKAKEKEKEKLAKLKAKEKEKERLAKEKAKEKEKQAKQKATTTKTTPTKTTIKKPKPVEEKVENPIVIEPEKTVEVLKAVNEAEISLTPSKPLENNPEKTIISNLEQLKEKIRAQKMLEKELMEKEATIIQTKDKSIQDKLGMIGGLEEDEAFDVSTDELDQQEHYISELQEQIDHLNSIIDKLVNLKIKDINIIDKDSYDISETFLRSNKLFEKKKEGEAKLNSKAEQELEIIKQDHEKAMKNLNAAEALYDKQLNVINELNHQISALNLELNKEKAKTKEFGIQVDSLTKQLLQLNKENTLLYSQLQESMKTNSSFEELINKNKKDYEKQIHNLENLYKSEVQSRAQAQEQLDLLGQVKTSLLQEITILNENFEQLKASEREQYVLLEKETKAKAEVIKELDDMKAHKSALEMNIQNLNQNLIQIKKREEIIQKKLDEETKSKKKVIEDLENLKEVNSQLSEEIDELKLKIVRIETHDSNITKKLDEELKTKKVTLQELEMLKEENLFMLKMIDQLNNQVEDLQNKEKSYLAKIEETNNSKLQVIQELEVMTKKNHSLELSINDINQQLSDLRYKEETLIKQLDDEIISKTLIIQEYDLLKIQNQDFINNLETVKSEKLGLIDELNILKEQKENLTTSFEEICKAKEELVNKQQDLNEQNRQNNILIEDLRNQTIELTERLSLLESEISKNSSELLEEISKLTTEKTRIIESLNKANLQNETLTNKNSDLDAALVDANNAKEATICQQETMKHELDSLYATLNDYRTKTYELENSLESEIKVKHELENQVEVFKTTTSEQMNSQQNLLAELDELKTMLETEKQLKAEAIEEIEHLNILISSINENSVNYEAMLVKNNELQEVYNAEKLAKSEYLKELEIVKQENIKLQQVIGELNRTNDFLKTKEQESQRLYQQIANDKAQLQKDVEILKLEKDSLLKNSRPREAYPYYEQPCSFYRTPYMNRPVYQEEKDPYAEEIRKLKSELDKIKKDITIEPQPIALIKEYREELNRNREQIKSMSEEKEKQLQEITVSYESKLQAKEEEKATLIQEKDESMRIIEILEEQIKAKDNLIQKMKSEIKDITEEDINDPDFKRKIRVIREMKNELIDRANQEEEVFSNSVNLIQEKIDAKRLEVDKINEKIKAMEDSYNASRIFTSASKEAFERNRSKALIERQLVEERIHELEDDLSRIRNKFKSFENSKQTQLDSLNNKEVQTTDFYLKKVQQEVTQNGNYKELKQTESEREELVKQLNELKTFQKDTELTPNKEQALNEKIAQNREQIRNRINILEQDIKLKTQEYNDYYSKLSQLKTELEKRLDYEKKLRNQEEKVFEYVKNKIYLNDCMNDYNNRESIIQEKQSKAESISQNPSMRSELLKVKAEIQDHEIYKDDLRSKIDYCKKTIKDLEEEDIVQKYNTLISQIDKIKTVQKEHKEKVESLKEDVHYKTKELETLRSKLA